MTRLLFPVPLMFLVMGVASCDTALNVCAVDAGAVTDTRIADVGAAADGGNVSDVGSTADVGPVVDIAPTNDGGIRADVAPTTDVSAIADAGIVADADAAAPDEASYSACRFGSGIGRILIAKKDFARDLCVVLVLDRPGTNSFAIVTPPGWGVEAAYEAPASGSDCQRVGLPAGAVSASGVTGVVAVTSSFVVGIDATLTFQATDGGPVSEHLAVQALDSSRTCSGLLFQGPGVDGGVGGDDGAPMSTLSIDFTGPGAHLFAAQWLVFQPAKRGGRPPAGGGEVYRLGSIGV